MTSTPKRFTEKLIITDTTNSTSPSVGSVTIAGGLGVVGDTTSSGITKFFGSNANYVAISAPSVNPSSSITLKLPNTLPTVSNSYIQSDLTGNLSYSTGFLNTFTTTTFPTTITSITGLSSFTNQFDILVNVSIIATTSLKGLFRLTGVLASSGWVISSMGISGDTTGMTFSITAGGQIQIIGSTTFTGFTSLSVTWTNYQNFPYSTGLNTLGGNVGIKVYTVSGTLSTTGSSTTTVSYPVGVTLTNIISCVGICYTSSISYPNGIVNSTSNGTWDITLTTSTINLITTGNSSNVLNQPVTLTLITNS
jgi:hypothetical protein